MNELAKPTLPAAAAPLAPASGETPGLRVTPATGAAPAPGEGQTSTVRSAAETLPLAAAISLRRVCKVYRLYQKPMYRMLDLLGLCPAGPEYYREHDALKDISLNIARGEKVAIIGRNGAGKSTLLKIITQAIQPSSGTLEVAGRISALLQIGTGFHVDFTGRQNVYSGLAHLGITGKDADEKFAEVVDFAELEEYIDQPMKTYSTGMCARLMFSASTVIEPDILVIDELLGVGDAYFQHKSFERMRRMCEKSGTTLLMVTHDIYAALNLCERFIWIDRGELKFDGDGKATIHAYENSVKEQEEERLRRRNMAALERKHEGVQRLRVLFRSRTGFALSAPLALARLEMLYEDGTSLALPVAAGAPGWHLLPEGNLGPPQKIDGRDCRCLEMFGSIYHKAEWVLDLPKSEGLKTLKVEWLYEGQESIDVLILGEDSSAFARASLAAAKGWQENAFALNQSSEAAETGEKQGQYGSGLIRITSVEFLNGKGESVVRIPHGERLVARVKFRVNGPIEPREPTFSMNFIRPGVAIGGVSYTDRLRLPEGDAFTLETVFDPLLFGSGQWLVSMGFYAADFLKQSYKSFFTVNPKAYHVIARGFSLQVDSSRSNDAYPFFIHPASFIVSNSAGEALRSCSVTRMETDGHSRPQPAAEIASAISGPPGRSGATPDAQTPARPEQVTETGMKVLYWRENANWNQKLLCITHTDRPTEREKCNLNYLTHRYFRPNRLPPDQPFDALKPTRVLSPFKGSVSIWEFVAGDFAKPRLLAHLRPEKYKAQHAIWHRGRLWILGIDVLEAYDRQLSRVAEITDPWLSGAHTVVPDGSGRLLATCSASDSVVRIDEQTCTPLDALRLPESIYGSNYPLTRQHSVVDHFIPNDFQLTHINAAWPWRGGILVSTLIGAIGWFEPGGDYQELLRGFVGCHGVRVDDTGRIYFSDSCLGALTFLAPDFRVERRVDMSSCWLHDAEQLDGPRFALAVTDRNCVEILDISCGTQKCAIPGGDFGNGVQFVNFGQ